MAGQSVNCELCQQPGGTLLWEDAACRIVRVNEPAYPGFCRVILKRHVKEMTDLEAAERQALMSVVFAVEQVVRALFSPDKINLASFGNVVPHLHWHIIPRWQDDRHFPDPIWATAKREPSVQRPLVSDAALATALADALAESR